jgi:hypothetical protein
MEAVRPEAANRHANNAVEPTTATRAGTTAVAGQAQQIHPALLDLVHQKSPA